MSADDPKSQRPVEVVYAGGTISSVATPEGHREGGYRVDLLVLLAERHPGFLARFCFGKTVTAYVGLSENMSFAYWEAIDKKVAEALARNPHAVLVTHGTDSMEQTAGHLRARFYAQLKAQNSKIVLVGANKDATHPEADVWDNLLFGSECASGDAEPDVYVDRKSVV